jgi:pyrrolidone-carboxylate peptidase
VKSFQVIDAVNLALELLIQSQKISLLVARAQAEGRKSLTPEEIEAIRVDRDAAISRLDAEIASREMTEGSGD